MNFIIFPIILFLTGLFSSTSKSVHAATLQCNSASKQKRVTLKNPEKFAGDQCVYTIKPHSSSVCQLLIQFDQFQLQPPSLNKQTSTLECGDHMTVGDVTLCGSNTGQHLYFPFHAAQGVKEFSITFSLPHHWPQNLWSLSITQLECSVAKRRNPFSGIPFLSGNMRTFFPMPPVNDVNEDADVLAPPGCNQYYRQTSGSIKSFNYNANNGPSYYLPNMNYVMCIKSPLEATMIEYHALSFSMSYGTNNSFGFDDDCRSAIQTTGRREDFLMIPQSNVADNLNMQPTYYCGTSLQRHTSILASPPFVMYFSSDSITDATETGFHINYKIRTLF